MINVHLNFRSVTTLTNLVKCKLPSVATIVIKFSPLKILGSDLANCRQIYIERQFTASYTGKNIYYLKNRVCT